MKIRVRFSKQGQMKFIGHLDMVRYFQKVMRRAKIDVAYTEGFSPHQKISFAAPLGVGLISKGEYFDIELNSSGTSSEMIELINAQNVEGVEVTGFKLLPDGAKNAMSIVAGADYKIYTDAFSEDDINKYFAREEIFVVKKTKKSEKETDIRPLIYDMKAGDGYVFMKVAQGSAANLKPELVMDSLAAFCKKDYPKYTQYERLDMYYLRDNELVSLDTAGVNIE